MKTRRSFIRKISELMELYFPEKQESDDVNFNGKCALVGNATSGVFVEFIYRIDFQVNGLVLRISLDK